MKGIIVSPSDGNLDTLAIFNADAKDRSMKLEMNISEPQYCLMILGDIEKPLVKEFFISPGDKIKFTASADNANNDRLDLNIDGSALNEEYSQANKRIFGAQEEEFSVFSAKIHTYERQELETNLDLQKSLQAEQMAIVNKHKEQINKDVLLFVQNNKKSIVSVIFLTNISANTEKEVLKKSYAGLSEEVKNSKIGLIVSQSLNKQGPEGLMEGNIVPAIVGENPKGETISLMEIASKHKLVLIDFWASWCGPCRRENPHVVKLYNQYKDKGFTVFGVSLDNKQEAWEEAIKKDQLDWYHVSDLLGWKSKLSAPYGVSGIPATFVIDSNGVLIAKNLRGKELEDFLKEKFK
ncbi:hypothetical protein AwDysgo_12550 [Bacteroidales bacterium]|nr:hypothetical protein AwDysgo_12550 [Bacteroidales bacterium]